MALSFRRGHRLCNGLVLFAFGWIGLTSILIQAAEPEDFDATFARSVVPLLNEFCIECHRGSDAEAMLDLTRFSKSEDVARSHQTWSELRLRLKSREMPPPESDKQPTAEQRTEIVAWIDRFVDWQAKSRAGDPGPVPVRRLSNSEFNYAVRDLTGVDIRPTREFPVDPANEAGFDNSAQSLTMSPALLNKFLEAARKTAEHMVLTQDGIEFAPHPVSTDTDRDKYCVKRIVDFYKRQPTDLADYFYAAWEQSAAGDDLSLDARAERHRISPKYLRTVNAFLTDRDAEVLSERVELGENGPGTEVEPHDVPIGAGPSAVLRRMFRNLPATLDAKDNVRRRCERMRDWIVELRGRLEPSVPNFNVKGIHVGAQAFVLWRNDQYAAYRQKPNLDSITKLAPGAPSFAIARALTVPDEARQRRQFVVELEEFCRIFPDAFYVAERGRDYVGNRGSGEEKGRLLSAGFHSMMGYYRDDQPLKNLVLNSTERAELDRMWDELDLVTSAPVRQYTGFVWFERTDASTLRGQEFDFARAEDKSVTTPEMIERLAATYYAQAKRFGADEAALDAIEKYFLRMNDRIQWMERTKRLAEPHHLNALLDLARHAYRRDLSMLEQAELIAFYRELKKSGAAHEEAVQDSFVSILMSPEFLYRVDAAASSPKVVPLSDQELASRLSFFLWSSIPDEELLRLAEQKTLRKPEVLSEQVDRMLRDPKAKALALEFGGQWLDFRRFESHNSVDRERFPAFDDELRSAMFEEPVRFLLHLLQSDAGVHDCLIGDYVWVNAVLAKHYGIPDDEYRSARGSDGWARIDRASRFDRGGLMTMSVFLTQNAPGRRTSPVKRGYWVVRRLLGEHIPAPPPKVPELPSDEAALGTLTLRETLAKHREHKSCAGCHNRFDSLGLAFENFGPIGERRERDLAGNKVDTRAVFPSGDEGEGPAGLKAYVDAHRRQDFIDNLSRKLLSFALGRTLLLSDELLVDELRRGAADKDARMSDMIRTIVLSPQFLNKRSAAQ
ncbi:MAG: DUF1592 domain-containing protein [Pirellulales bacterium]